MDSQPTGADTYTTRASLLLRVKASDPEPRELAWEEFRDRYEPIIAGFARKLGTAPHDVDDIVQDVIAGFFAVSPKFVYDPAKGRFRGYLKTCTVHAMNRQRRQNAKFRTGGAEAIRAEDIAIEHVWNDVWEQEQLRKALERTRVQYDDNATFRAFEAYVLQGQPAERVAEELGLRVNSVHQARTRVTQALKANLLRISEEEG